MNNTISCCGVNCEKCEYYQRGCDGCNAIEGKAHWLQYTGGDICDIYLCCVVQKSLAHCGKCVEFPCERYEGGDPTKSEEENLKIFESQKEQLLHMK